jgi:hypothetical protein
MPVARKLQAQTQRPPREVGSGAIFSSDSSKVVTDKFRTAIDGLIKRKDSEIRIKDRLKAVQR